MIPLRCHTLYSCRFLNVVFYLLGTVQCWKREHFPWTIPNCVTHMVLSSSEVLIFAWRALGGFKLGGFFIFVSLLTPYRTPASMRSGPSGIIGFWSAPGALLLLSNLPKTHLGLRFDPSSHLTIPTTMGAVHLLKPRFPLFTEEANLSEGTVRAFNNQSGQWGWRM